MNAEETSGREPEPMTEPTVEPTVEPTAEPTAEPAGETVDQTSAAPDAEDAPDAEETAEPQAVPAEEETVAEAEPGDPEVDPEDDPEDHADEEPAPAAAALDLDESHELNIGQEQVLELVSFVVVNLVEHPDEVTVDVIQRQGRDIFQVRVHPEDLGKVIGRGGQTARALRVLLMAVSARTNQRIGLEIVE